MLQEADNSVQVQIASPEELNQLTNLASGSSPQQIVGEIDPRTGILHTSTGTEPPPGNIQMGEEVTIQVGMRRALALILYYLQKPPHCYSVSLLVI